MQNAAGALHLAASAPQPDHFPRAMSDPRPDNAARNLRSHTIVQVQAPHVGAASSFMPSARTISAVVERFVERRRSDPHVTPDLFAVEIGGAFSDDERRALEACVEAEALLADEAVQLGAAPDAAPGVDVLEGTTVGDFRLLRVIGRGGSGVVYLSEQLSLGRPTAVKVLHPACASSPAWRERFLREAEALARMNHPNIVPVLAAGDDGGLLYLAMVLVEGSGLDRNIERAAAAGRCALDAAATARLGTALADALHHAHERGLVHRDIKPSNILVTRSGHPYVVDFGLARADDRSRLTRTGETVGTPLYMAPEQVDRRVGEVDARTDVFGLGLSLIEASTGWAPSLEPKHPSSPFAATRKLPRDLGTVLLRAIDPDPRRRYADAAALRDDLQRYLDGAPVQARRTGVLLRLRRWALRRPVVAAAAALLVLSTSGVGAWAWEREQTRRDQISQLRVDASLSLDRGDLERARREVAGLRERGFDVGTFDARLDLLTRKAAADRSLDAARAGVFDPRAQARNLERTRDQCDEALHFYTGRDSFEPLVLKSIAQFRQKQFPAARATGLAAAASRNIPLEGEVLAELDALGMRLLLSSIGGAVVKDVSAGEALAAIPDDKVARLRAFVVEHAKDSPELVLVAGFLLDVAGRHGEALDLYDRVLDLNPRQPLALVAKASSCLAADDLRAARDAARTAVTVAPERASSHWVLARIQWRLGQPEEALRSVDEGIARQDGSLSPWLLKAEILAATDRLEEAAAALETAATIDPDAGLPVIDRADLLTTLERWDDALAAYRGAIGKADVKAGHARGGEGKVLLQLGRHREAREALDQALAENRVLAHAWFWKSHVDLALHEPDPAADAALMALRLVQRIGPATKVEEYAAWHAQIDANAGERAAKLLRASSNDDLERAITSELRELKFDDHDLSRWLELAVREHAAGDAGAACRRLESALKRAVTFAGTPGPRVDRTTLRASLARTFEAALDHFDVAEQFAHLREADGYEAVAMSPF